MTSTVQSLMFYDRVRTSN